MNEKIKQLCEQAKVYATESTKDFTGDDPVVWMDYYTEKFAQLIVRECIAQCEKNKDHEWLGSGSKLSAFNIREHFEVK